MNSPDSVGIVAGDATLPARGSRRRVALAAALLAPVLIAAFAWFALTRDAWRSKPAPDVSFTTITGERIALSELRGRVVLVNFWATSCVICIQEMPGLAALHRRLEARGLTTIAVAMPYDRPDSVLRYARRVPLPFPIALDPVGDASAALGPIDGTPTLLVIDRDGRIVRTLVGAYDLRRLDAFVERKLAPG